MATSGNARATRSLLDLRHIPDNVDHHHWHGPLPLKQNKPQDPAFESTGDPDQDEALAEYLRDNPVDEEDDAEDDADAPSVHSKGDSPTSSRPRPSIQDNDFDQFVDSPRLNETPPPAAPVRLPASIRPAQPSATISKLAKLSSWPPPAPPAIVVRSPDGGVHLAPAAPIVELRRT